MTADAMRAAASGGKAASAASGRDWRVVPMLLPSLTAGLGEIPIPDIEGFGLSVDSIALDGPDSGYVNVNGDLSVN